MSKVIREFEFVVSGSVEMDLTMGKFAREYAEPGAFEELAEEILDNYIDKAKVDIARKLSEECTRVTITNNF